MMEATLKNTDEQERLKALATGVIRELKHDELKDVTATSEVLVLTPVHEKGAFRISFTRIDQSSYSSARRSSPTDTGCNVRTPGCR